MKNISRGVYPDRYPARHPYQGHLYETDPLQYHKNNDTCAIEPVLTKE